MASTTTSETVDRTAREAIASVCAEVSDPVETDHVDGVVPGLVARPADRDQVAQVLRAAAAHGLTVVPRGRGTKLSWGVAPSTAHVLLDVSALDQVLDHAAGDLIVAAPARSSRELGDSARRRCPARPLAAPWPPTPAVHAGWPRAPRATC